MRIVISKCKAFYRMISQTIYVGSRLKHNLLALTIISSFCAVMGVALIILDVLTDTLNMLPASILALVFGIGCAIFSGLLKMRKVAIIFPTLFCGVMLAYYTLTGAANGTAILWSLIMPIGLCYFVGFRVGIGMSVLYAIFFLVMFYSPLNQYISSLL